MPKYFEPLLQPAPALALLDCCRQLGFAVPAQATATDLACFKVLAPPADMESLLDLLNPEQAEKASQTHPLAELALPAPLERWGCARLEAAYAEDLVYEIAPEMRSYPLAHLGLVESAPPQPLALLFAELRDALGDRDWLVYWGEAAGQLWLLGLFPWGWQWQAHWLELPDLSFGQQATPLSVGVLQAAAREWRERLDPAWVEHDHEDFGWLEQVRGQLLLSEAESQRLLGFVPGRPRPLQATDYLRFWRLSARARKTTEAIWETFLVPYTSLEGFLKQWQEVLRLFLPVYFELGELLQSGLQVLENKGVLSGFLARHLSPASRQLHALKPVRELAQQLVINKGGEKPSLSEMLKFEELRKSWQHFLTQYGHSGWGGFDLARPRYLDHPRPILLSLLSPWNAGRPMASVSWQEKRWSLLWQYTAKLHEVRETLLSDTLWALHQLRQRLNEHVMRLCDQGLLPSPEDLWYLWPEEVKQLQAGQAVPTALLERRRQSWQQSLPLDQPASAAIGLNNGLCRGKIWQADQPQWNLPEGYKPNQTILLTTEIDEGWIPILAQVGGVLLRKGGPLTRSGLLLRELNLPTICQLGALELANGTWAEFDSASADIQLEDPETP